MEKNSTKIWRLFFLNLLIFLVVLFSFLSLGRNESITVNAMALNVRKGPGIDYEITTQATQGQTLTILEKKDQWYQVKLDNETTGWVASWLVEQGDSSPATNLSAKVNTADTKLRKESSADSEILATLSKDTEVTVTLEQNSWSKVKFKKQEGWIHSELLTLIDPNEEDTINEEPEKLFARQDNTKIRTEPHLESDIVTTINYGEELVFLASDNDWYQVKTAEGDTGYVANWVVSLGDFNQKNTKKITSIAETTIVLDPGHGGSDVGAIDNSGEIYEKYITLATARYVKKELAKEGANIILTRDGDDYISLSHIALKSNRAKADIFISFHYDSTELQNQASGTTTYYYNEQNKELAEIVNQHLGEELSLPNRGTEFGDYQVLRENNQPAILLELGYMNNDGDVKLFKTKKYQRSVAKAVTNALIEYFE